MYGKTHSGHGLLIISHWLVHKVIIHPCPEIRVTSAVYNSNIFPFWQIYSPQTLKHLTDRSSYWLSFHQRIFWAARLTAFIATRAGFTDMYLTHWGRATHICVSKLTNIGSDNGLSPGRRQAIIWTNVGILLIRTLGTNFSEILSETHKFSFRKIYFKMSSGKWRPSCLGLNVLSHG